MSTDGWSGWDDEEGPHRLLYGRRHQVGAAVVGGWAMQEIVDRNSGGTRVHVESSSEVYVDRIDQHGQQVQCFDLTRQEARELAVALLRAASDVDTMAGVEKECDSRSNRMLVADDTEGRIEVECRPFEPDMPDYDGQRFLAIHVDGREESFVCLTAEQAAELAALLVVEPAAS
ncbi:hypothetical protein [Mycolicibacterium grossiae]|uniref:hypothetical protein n=1 Tax=Mycolicibacterium grossiae TaxID=1552759 RepID=UPI0011F386B3|nr:hypothetical protein [Mycolicibacterium grossiae]QEM47169.1 hypothetical protein FZ046_22475 [Mycolicibacterium grossiae]